MSYKKKKKNCPICNYVTIRVQNICNLEKEILKQMSFNGTNKNRSQLGENSVILPQTKNKSAKRISDVHTELYS